MAALVLGKAGIREDAPVIRRVLVQWDSVTVVDGRDVCRPLKKVDAIPDSLKESVQRKRPASMAPASGKAYRRVLQGSTDRLCLLVSSE